MELNGFKLEYQTSKNRNLPKLKYANLRLEYFHCFNVLSDRTQQDNSHGRYGHFYPYSATNPPAVKVSKASPAPHTRIVNDLCSV